MIGVVIPAHNEEHHNTACLTSILFAAKHPALTGQPVSVVVVLDDCSDQTGQIVSANGVTGIEASFQSVGKARATGADHLLAAGAEWLAFTDADTAVPHDWLARQIEFKLMQSLKQSRWGG